MSEHMAPYAVVVQMLDGEAEITIAGKHLKAKPGDMIIMPANISHALKAERSFKMLLTVVRGK